MTADKKIAFALGGLAGNNAHGAGFLHAALERKITPTTISCTSGQIHWVNLYLQAIEEEDYRLLEREIDKQALAQNELTARLKDATKFVWGKQPIRLPYPWELTEDAIKTVLSALRTAITDIFKEHDIRFLMEFPKLFLNLVPGRLLVPNFQEKYLFDIAKSFQKSTIGIVFNTYNPQTGCEHVHMNNAAKTQLNTDFDTDDCDLEKEEDECKLAASVKPRYRYRTRNKKISARSIMDALWIFYAYGFDKKHSIYKREEDATIDGALWRQVMLSELVDANIIYAVRPINSRWQGELPNNWPGNEDMKWEMLFNSAYMGERDKIHLINKLKREGKLKEQEDQNKNFHCIDIVDIEIKTQEAYLEYFAESKEVFSKAENQALQAFDMLS